MDLSEFVKSVPKSKHAATESMVAFASKIAEGLNLDYPDFTDFADTQEFIDNNLDDYNQNCSDERGHRK